MKNHQADKGTGFNAPSFLTSVRKSAFGNPRKSLFLSNWLRNFTASRPALSYAVFLFVALVLPVVLGTMLVSSDTHAGTDTAGNTSGYYVSVTSADNLNLSVNGVPGGAVASTSDTLSVSSNTPNGYKVYISATANTTGANYLCPAGVTPSTSACFVPTTSANTLSDLTTNSWGYSLDGTSYSPVPLFGSGVAIINKTSTTSESSVSKSIHFGVKADMAMPSDTYTGTILYTAIADISGTTRLTTISPTSTENISGGDTLTVTIPYISSRPESEIKNATSITIGGTSCPVQTITKITSPYTGIQATCTMPAKSAGTYTVSVAISQAGGGSQGYTGSSQIEYEVPKDPSLFFNLTSMQDMVASICNQVETPSASATTSVTTLSAYNNASDKTAVVPTLSLTDSRDSQSYTVKKLADGNCWMTENLRYGITTGGAARAYTSDDAAKSNNVNTTNMAKLTTSKICTTNSNCKNPNGSSTTAFVSSAINYTDPYIMIYQANNTGYEVDPSGWASAPDKDYKFGVLYNYCAATGGTACTASGTTPTVSGSVCPKGWTLPSFNQPTSYSTTDKTTDGSRKDLMNLRNNYGAESSATGVNVLTTFPLSFVLSGYANSGSLNYRSSSGTGRYWSSTPYSSANNAYSLFVDSSTVYRSYYNRYFGYSVRCVSAS